MMAPHGKKGKSVGFPVRLCLYYIELDPNFCNLPPSRLKLLINVPLYNSSVAHGHGRGNVSDHIYKHRRTGAHRTEVVNPQ